LIIRVICF